MCHKRGGGPKLFVTQKLFLPESFARMNFFKYGRRKNELRYLPGIKIQLQILHLKISKGQFSSFLSFLASPSP